MNGNDLFTSLKIKLSALCIYREINISLVFTKQRRYDKVNFQLTEKEQYILLRKRKKIKLRQIAEYLDCSMMLISLYENDKSGMAENKVTRYKEYIEKY